MFTATANLTLPSTVTGSWPRPRWFDVSMSLAKRFKAGGARYLEIRAEAFNILNHPNFGPPGRDINTPNTFGIFTSTVGSPRVVELVAKFFF